MPQRPLEIVITDLRESDPGQISGYIRGIHLIGLGMGKTTWRHAKKTVRFSLHSIMVVKPRLHHSIEPYICPGQGLVEQMREARAADCPHLWSLVQHELNGVVRVYVYR
jgi:hypothetical protein